MSYRVKEIYYTLQGEGQRAGRAAVFCRFSGCNLWSGRESERSKAVCWFCDTDFVGTDGVNGGFFESVDELADRIAGQWPHGLGKPYVVFTGGEPLLQLDEALLAAMRKRGFETAVETNGTRPRPQGLDWVTVSPKPRSKLILIEGDELKLVFPQEVSPESVRHLNFKHFLLSPRTSSDPDETSTNLQAAIAYCCSHPQWQLTMQYHKLWNIR